MSIKRHHMVAFCLLTLFLSSGCETAINKTVETVNEKSKSPESVEVIKSPNDERNYRAITLPNSMEVLLVSDPDSEKSAASLSLGVGYYYDPMEQQGLGHFLEHMLSKGSDKYPGVDEFSQFISNNGGTRNASTSTEVTNYMFSIQNQAYDGALDRFSEFFKTPKLYAEYTDKEKNAVNAEASMSTENDWRAQWQLKRNYMGDHPVNRFTTGNLETLSDKEGSLLHPEMLAFYDKYYSANIMKLAMLSNASLDEMEVLARKHFASIENKNIPEPEITAEMPDFATKRIYLVPNNDVKQVRLDFTIKNNIDQFAYKPNSFISYLIGSEMPGTPAYLLKEQGLISSLSSYASEDLYGNYGVLEVTLSLTEQGLKQRDFIVATMMQYIDLIRAGGVDKKYFKEIQTSLNNQFRFLEKINDFSYVSRLASTMHDFPIQHVLNAPYYYPEFNKAAIEETLEQLTPENLLVWYISQDEETDKELHFYKGEYRTEALSEKEIASWSNNSKLALTLPQVNRLLPENFELFTEASKEGDTPTLAFDDKGIQIWNFPSEHFAHQPKGVMQVMINNPDSQTNAAAEVMQSIWASMFNLQQSALATEASVAGMNMGLSPSNGLTLSISGFTDKQDMLVEQAFSNLVVDVTEENFAQAVERYVRGVENIKKQRAISQAMGFYRKMVSSGNFNNETLISTAKLLSTEDLTKFIKQTLDNNLIRAFTFGNYNDEAIDQLVKNINKMFSDERLVTDYTKTKYWLPRAGETLVYRGDTEVEDAALVDLFMHPKPGYKSKATAAILIEHYHRLAFKQLRTEEQLGYIVQAADISIDDYIGLAILVQSPVKNTQDLQKRFDAFNLSYVTALAELTEEEFNQIKASELTNLKEDPKNLREEISPLVSDWVRENMNFDSRQKMIAATEQVTLSDLKEFFNQTVANKDAARISVQIRGKKFAEQPFASFDNEVVVKSIDDFHAKTTYQ